MISVVVPCYNVADTLTAQVERLLPQIDDVEGELVLVDNNSTDTTSSLLEILSENRRVTVVEAVDLQSASHARNVGVARSSGDILMFCDADDLVDHEWVRRLADATATAPVVTGQLDTFDLNSQEQRSARGDSKELAKFYGFFPIAHGGNMAMTRTAWTDIGPFDEQLCSAEDMEWSMRAHLAGYDIVKVPDAVIHYRFRSTPGALWRQGLAYGSHRPEVARRVYERCGHRVSRIAGAKSWAWLFVHAPSAARRSGRAQLAWVAGNRIGHLRGSLRSRFLVL